MPPPATPDDQNKPSGNGEHGGGSPRDTKGGEPGKDTKGGGGGKRGDDVFWCPVCGQKHRGDLSGIKAGGVMRSICASCHRPLAVKWEKGVATVTAGTSGAGRHGGKSRTEPGAHKAPKSTEPKIEAASSSPEQGSTPEKKTTGHPAPAAPPPATGAATGPKVPSTGAAGTGPAPGTGAAAEAQPAAAAAATATPSPTPLPISAAADWTGTLVEGRYRITSLLGVGGMGTAYQARDERMNRTVVIKVPHPALLADEGFRKRFEHEIRSLTTLEHPHVVKAFDVGVHGGVPYAVLQHLGGGSLADKLGKSGGKMPANDVIRWLPGVAEALDFIHGQGMVHRDVKPANILFDEAGHSFVADLGIAKARSGQHTGLTQTGQTPGSPEYMAPEVLAGVPVGPAYDQYSLGVVVYEALSGRAPLVAQNALALLLKKRTEKPTPLRETAPTVPPAAAAAVTKALETDPTQRFPSCVAFARAFVHGVRAPLEEQKKALEEAQKPAAKPTSRGRNIAIAVVALLVVVGAVVAFSMKGGEPPAVKPEIRIDGLKDGGYVATRDVPVEGLVFRGTLASVWVNGVPTPVRDRRFATVVRAPDDGDVTISVATSDGGPSLWTAHVTVDTVAPRVEVTDPPSEAAKEYLGAKATILGAVVDANPDRLIVNAVPQAAEGAFPMAVDLPEGGEKVLVLEAVDKAGNRSAQVLRRLRRQGSGPAWLEPLQKAKDAQRDGNWTDAAKFLDEAFEKGVPLIEVPASLSQPVNARKALEEAKAFAAKRDWPAARDALNRARMDRVIPEKDFPKDLLDLLAAQDKIAEADRRAFMQGDWVAAVALVEEAKALGAIDNDMPRRLREGLAVRDRVAKAEAAAAKSDWAAVKEFVDAARAHGATDADIPKNVRDGLAVYETVPSLSIDEPAEGSVVTVPTFLVRGKASYPRDGDALQVEGAVGAVPSNATWTAIVTVSEATEGGPFPAKVVVRVMDGAQVRAEVVRNVEYRPSPVYTKFLAGWAMPLGSDVDRAGYPTRIRRLRDQGVMVLVPAGRFKMGSERGGERDEKPAHTVTLSKGFYMDATEVTVAQFRLFVQRQKYATLGEKDGKGRWRKNFDKLDDPTADWEDANGLAWDAPAPGTGQAPADHPVTQVAWDDADAFAKWAGASLPTEAQMEYVVSEELKDTLGADAEDPLLNTNLFDASGAIRFQNGAAPGAANDGAATTAAVTRGKAYLGLFHDLVGNVWEWCADWYAKDYYGRSPSKDPPGPPAGTPVGTPAVASRVARGGSWAWPQAEAKGLVKRRLPLDPKKGRPDVGFRLARWLP